MDDGADDSLAGGDVTTIRTSTRALGESVRAGEGVGAMGSRRVRPSITQCWRHVARAIADLEDRYKTFITQIGSVGNRAMSHI
jgi:hypothetical protein